MIGVIPVVILVFLIALTLCLLRLHRRTEPFAPSQGFKSDPAYQAQVRLLNDKYEPRSGGRRPVRNLIDTDTSVPPQEEILVNFQALGCRYPGYLGPMMLGYMDPAVGVQMAVMAGCRVFVLDIDYIDKCVNDSIGYFPRLVVRDSQGKLLINDESKKPLCQSPQSFELRTICQAINDYAFSGQSPQGTDPVILVLYFQRQPPGSYKSKPVLDYFSHVARALAPLENRLLLNEPGGKFYRHQQEGTLLTKPMKDYEGKVLIFNNANTSGFTEASYPAMEDLDFLTNLRLYQSQTKLGVTEQAKGTYFATLQTAEDLMMIPEDRQEQAKADTTLRWTLCLSQNPAEPVTKEVYDKVMSLGAHCVPMLLTDEKNDYLYADNRFKTHSFIFKPEALRYRKPPIVVPGEPSPVVDARGGNLRTPSL